MSKTASTNIKLGIFVIIGSLLLIGAIYFISSKQQLFNKTIRITGVFNDVVGFKPATM